MKRRRYVVAEHITPVMRKTWKLGRNSTISVENGKAFVYLNEKGEVDVEAIDKAIDILMMVKQEMEA